MDFRYITYTLNGLLMIALPIVLGIIITRRYKLGWRLWWIGAVVFVISQLFHIPFNLATSPFFNTFVFISLPLTLQIGIQSLFLGLSAGVFEECCRYGMYRWWAKDARSWEKGIQTGAGHGGIEAILLGVLALYGFIQLAVLRNVDLSTVLTSNQMDIVRTQVEAAWSARWYETMLGALERLFTIPLHLALSVMVSQVFTRKNGWWLFVAILFHTVVDGTVVFLQKQGLSSLALEGVVGGFAIISIAIIFVLKMKSRDPESSSIEQLDPVRIVDNIDNIVLADDNPKDDGSVDATS